MMLVSKFHVLCCHYAAKLLRFFHLCVSFTRSFSGPSSSFSFFLLFFFFFFFFFFSSFFIVCSLDAPWQISLLSVFPPHTAMHRGSRQEDRSSDHDRVFCLFLILVWRDPETRVIKLKPLSGSVCDMKLPTSVTHCGNGRGSEGGGISGEEEEVEKGRWSAPDGRTCDSWPVADETMIARPRKLLVESRHRIYPIWIRDGSGLYLKYIFIYFLREKKKYNFWIPDEAFDCVAQCLLRAKSPLVPTGHAAVAWRRYQTNYSRKTRSPR